MTASAAPLPRLVLCEIGETDLPGVESYSPFCVKVHRALKYLGLPYERRFGLPSTFKRYHSSGQVPVLLIEQVPRDLEAVGDSTDILVRLQEIAARTFHGTGDARLEGEADLWEELADVSLANYLIAARWADERNWPGVRDRIFASVPRPLRGIVGERVRKDVVRGLVAREVWRFGAETCWRRFEVLLDALEARAPEEGFWLGTFTSADLALFAQLFSLRQSITPWQSEQISARYRLSRYVDRVDAATRGTV